jgi:hypothetical protein
MKNPVLMFSVALALLLTVNPAQANLSEYDASEAIATKTSAYSVDSDIALEQAVVATKESATAIEYVSDELATSEEVLARDATIERLSQELISIRAEQAELSEAVQVAEAEGRIADRESLLDELERSRAREAELESQRQAEEQARAEEAAREATIASFDTELAAITDQTEAFAISLDEATELTPEQYQEYVNELAAITARAEYLDGCLSEASELTAAERAYYENELAGIMDRAGELNQTLEGYNPVPLPSTLILLGSGLLGLGFLGRRRKKS